MKNFTFRKEFDHEMSSWKERVTELEKTYSELLKLKKPAEYWASRAKRYGFQGSLFLLAMVVGLAGGLLYFYEIFSTWLIGKTLNIQLNTIQGIIIFGTIAATYAYLLRTLSRLCFSAFHLMRDAEEREQLTYLYLSLMHEAVIDKDSRDIILQALFSRSETGLLVNESGPTMPSIVDTVRVASKVKT